MLYVLSLFDVLLNLFGAKCMKFLFIEVDLKAVKRSSDSVKTHTNKDFHVQHIRLGLIIELFLLFIFSVCRSFLSLMAFGVVFSIAMLNPKGFEQMLEKAASLFLNIEAGLFVFLMIQRARNSENRYVFSLCMLIYRT